MNRILPRPIQRRSVGRAVGQNEMALAPPAIAVPVPAGGYFPSPGPMPPVMTAPGPMVDPRCPYPEKAWGTIVDSIAASDTDSFTVETSGVFCPSQMTMSGELDDVYITQITTGMRKQVIEGRISARLFDSARACCLVTCLDCLCMPGVKMKVDLENGGSTASGDIGVLVKGTYADVCPPGATAADPGNMRLPYPPACGPNEKFIGFDRTIAASDTATIAVETPGRFCPRAMYASGPGVDSVVVDSISTGLENELILGPVALAMWSVDNECCRFDCFKCICAPGVKMTIELRNVTGAEATVHVDLVGSYQDAC